MASEISLFYKQKHISCLIPVAPSLVAGISLARAGDMALSRGLQAPDRRALLDSLGASAARVFAVHQVHSTEVLVVDHQDPESLALVEADGLVTHRSDVLLTVTIADCLPIFLSDQVTGALGLVHSGWKGTGIVGEALRAMAKAFGTRAQDVGVVIGPGIGACCYTVPQERYERFRVAFGDQAVTRGPGGDYRLDLKAANVRLLEEAGVAKTLVISDCTCCSPALGSFRREGRGFRRMLAYIGGAGAFTIADKGGVA